MTPTVRRQAAWALTPCALAICLLTSGTSFAQDAEPSSAPTTGSTFRFSGFGTIGASNSSEDKADFTSSIEQPNGAGYTRDWSFSTDSRIGLQFDAKFNPRLSASVQAIARHRYDNSFTPDLTMAFAKWQPVAPLAIRVGRMPYPSFLISDYRNVGYAQVPLRTPLEMYYLQFVHHYDGADFTWTQNVGNVPVKTSVFYGNAKVKGVGDVSLEPKPIYGGSVSAEFSALLIRASYLTGKLTLRSPQIDSVFAGVRYGLPGDALYPGSPALPGAPELADQYEMIDKATPYTSVGFTYDPGRWFANGEYSIIGKAGFTPEQKSAYITGGFVIGDWKPYLTLAKARREPPPPVGHPLLDAFRQQIAAPLQSSTSVGVRWDAVRNVAVKAQFDWVKPGAGGPGMLVNPQPDYVSGQRYRVFSAVVDFVF